MTKIAFSSMALDKKLEREDEWKKFNASFSNMELETIEVASAIFLGHPFTTWHKDGWRRGDNYLLGQHIAIDFDTGDERSSLPYLLKDRFMARYGGLLYTTPSHTPEAPRSRCVFLLDTPIHQPKNYVLAVRSLLWVYGKEGADVKCKDPCRFFYGSKNCEMEYLDSTLPLDVVKGMIQQYLQTGETEKRQRTDYTPTADQAEVQAALRAIPAWSIDYDQWVSILMGIHGAFGDAGLPLAEAWAQGKDGEVAQKWRSFKQNGNGAGRVTLNSVFHLANKYGYQGMKPA